MAVGPVGVVAEHTEHITSRVERFDVEKDGVRTVELHTIDMQTGEPLVFTAPTFREAMRKVRMVALRNTADAIENGELP